MYDHMLFHIRTEFFGPPYQIPSKKWVNSKIPQTRGVFNFNAIQTISMPPYNMIGNKQPFFRRYLLGEIMVNNINS
ncbi:hypothetical protein HZS_6506 [Henneguya salminicola]|nr:hypothetical protein HZS_6506 [Henneguya salminicola]